MNVNRLGAIDAAYLAAESPHAPLHVASIGIFDRGELCDAYGRPRVEEIRARIDSRLGTLPRLRQRVQDVPFDLGRPVWVDDERFDIANHVDFVGLPAPHDETALLRLTEETIMEPLDRTQPLWHLRFVTGLPGDRVALIERAHHAMIDGVSGVDVALVLLDASPDAPDVIGSVWKPCSAPSLAELVRSALVDRWSAPVDAALHAVSRLAHPEGPAHTVADVATALTALRKSGIRAPRCSLNQPVGSTRRLSLIRQRLDGARDVARRSDAKVNDVVLTAVAGGVRRLLLNRGEPLPPDRFVKALIPVSVRTGSEAMALGNRVGGLLAPLPIGIGDPAARLARIAATTKALKDSREAATTDLLLHAANLVSPRATRVMGRSVNRQPLVNLIVTNIPGPNFPLYAMGARMLEAFPIVPLGGNMTLEVAVLSYDGQLNLCVTSDRKQCPDVDVFVDGVEHTFEQLGASWVTAVA